MLPLFITSIFHYFKPIFFIVFLITFFIFSSNIDAQESNNSEKANPLEIPIKTIFTPGDCYSS